MNNQLMNKQTRYAVNLKQMAVNSYVGGMFRKHSFYLAFICWNLFKWMANQLMCWDNSFNWFNTNINTRTIRITDPPPSYRNGHLLERSMSKAKAYPFGEKIIP